MEENATTVGDAMTKLVLTVGPEHTLLEAAQKMAERGVGSAVITDPDGLGPGLVAERDIVRAIAAGRDLSTELVRDHAARDSAVAFADWPLEQATQVMMRGRCRHLVVVDGGEPIGIVSIRDIVAAWQPLAAAAHGIAAEG